MKPKLKQPDVDRVLYALRHGRWIKGRKLCAQTGVAYRLIRAIAQETGKIISSQRGYKLTAHATPEELQEAHADLVSRAAKIKNRANLLERQITARQQAGVLI